MKIFLLFLTICFAFANAQFYYDKHGESRGAYKDSLEYSKLVELANRFRGSILVKKPIEGVKPRKNLEKIPEDKIQRTFNVSRDTLDKENWLEVEKNEIVKICVDEPVVAWETSLKAIISSDSCLAFQAPMLVGVETLRVHFYKEYMPYYINFYNDNNSYEINLAVGMKYLDFKDEEVLLGFDEFGLAQFVYGAPMEDPERLVSVTGTYLIDKYPVTNCEFTQLMWDSIPTTTSHKSSIAIEPYEAWLSRKRNNSRNQNCLTNDSAASTVFLYQALKYANARSIREGLKPYYIFSDTKQRPKILSKGEYIIGYFSFTKYSNNYIHVSVDTTSNGYRLPYYNEWMMLARGGDKNKGKKAPWGDENADVKDVQKYARFGKTDDFYGSDSVGRLQPNKYGLYDMFGLVNQHVLFEKYNPFAVLNKKPSCLKGGSASKSLKCEDNYYGCWKIITYGYSVSNNIGAERGGFRLIRNIGKRVKWTEVKSDKE